MARLNYDKLEPKLKARIRAAIAAEGDRRTKQKRNEQVTLEPSIQDKASMVDLDGSLLIRLVRRYDSRRGRRYDDDNLVGGFKELRDAVTALLGRPGDSEKDGLSFEYSQEKAEEQEVVIEIYRL